jgi:hypothetical protein
VLLTRSRLCPGPKPGSSLHLHVLSTPPAFVLSQDQTLRKSDSCRCEHPKANTGGTSLTKVCQIRTALGPRTQCGALGLTRSSILAACNAEDRRCGGSNLDATKARGKSLRSHTLLSFQRPPRLLRRGLRRSLDAASPRAIKKASPGEAHPRRLSLYQRDLRGALLQVGLVDGHLGTGECSDQHA